MDKTKYLEHRIAYRQADEDLKKTIQQSKARLKEINDASKKLRTELSELRRTVNQLNTVRKEYIVMSIAVDQYSNKFEDLIKKYQDMVVCCG